MAENDRKEKEPYPIPEIRFLIATCILLHVYDTSRLCGQLETPAIVFSSWLMALYHSDRHSIKHMYYITLLWCNTVNLHSL